MYTTSRRRALLLTVLVMVGGTLISALVAGRYAQQRALAAESAQVQRQLGLYAQTLQQRIDRFGTLPQVLALDPDLRASLSRPLDAAEVKRLNLKLQQANSVTQSSTLTLIDHRGVAVAASNWDQASSNVGEDYSYRPYFQQAMLTGRGHFYGIGMTTGVPGYFLSQAIYDDEDSPIGVIAIKIELRALEQEWLQSTDIVLASDAHDVVFLANGDEWRYRLLRPLAPIERREMLATRQYADRSLQALQSRTLDVLADGGRMVRVAQPSLPRPVLWQTYALTEPNWKLHLLHDASASGAVGRSTALAAGGIWLALCFLSLFIQQRRRLAAHRQRSRRELESVLQQHAQELRTAQDGILQAAQDADSGLSRSLAHLPQGVVVIDNEQKLVAWNARYLELFRFPSELVKVGRPIEEIFRFNARRGLLGPGPMDEAIERRLNHLRSGRPHMRESEKDDGTVLEIRGNPLPDGGFVTSYADITAYKNTARELRSLADALEHRVAERTRDLDEARREAERANRYKTRFVASAVHDLLQPLNAARMFVSVLRGKLQGDARELSEHVDAALAAQDAILNSLLDISRLESGTLQTNVRAFALSPLLETLAREFGIAAQSRGLQLDWVDTKAVVISDEALLRRILQNFLSNALRYTPRGRVLIGCRRDGDQLRIEVHDQGPGIPESLQGEIFEEFRRLNDGVEQERGAGLGLAIVERIGRLLGHRISLRSTLGKGSVFCVTVALGKAEAVVAPVPVVAPADPGDESPLRQCRVWSIDDDPRVCAATRALLERWGCNVELADGPQAALEIASAFNVPQLLLLDVRMGEWRGPDLYEELCLLWQARPPVILVTAERDDALKAHAAEQGWGFLPKPVRPPALRALMTQLLVRHRGPGG